MQFKLIIDRNPGKEPKVRIKESEENKERFFDLTVFGDLIENAVSNKGKEAFIDFGMIFGCADREEWMDYCQVVCDLRAKIEQGKLATLGDLEKYRPFYGLTFEHTFVAKKENGSILPIQFGFSELEPPFFQDMETGHYCIYKCFSMKDAVFSLLHYLFLNEYKLKKCEHCGKYFPTKTLKIKYCSRNSPYEGQENNSCSVAVDHILKTIKKRRKNILRYMNVNFPKAIPEFDDELYAALKKPKSVAQLAELTRLTNSEYVKEHWYGAEYK